MSKVYDGEVANVLARELSTGMWKLDVFVLATDLLGEITTATKKIDKTR